jgi:hypothetical protein
VNAGDRCCHNKLDSLSHLHGGSRHIQHPIQHRGMGSIHCVKGATFQGLMRAVQPQIEHMVRSPVACVAGTSIDQTSLVSWVCAIWYIFATIDTE